MDNKMDGYILIEIGKGSYTPIETVWVNKQAEVKIKMNGMIELVKQLPSVENSLVMVFFKYFLIEADYWRIESEEIFNVVEFQIIKNNYKEYKRYQKEQEIFYK